MATRVRIATPERVAEMIVAALPPSAQVWNQPVAMGSWTIPHTIGRLPNVAVYVGGELIDADVSASDSTVTIGFASPQSGIAILN